MSRIVLLLTASRQPYQRAGFAIGGAAAPTRIDQNDERFTQEARRKLFADPVIAIALEIEQNGVSRVVKLSAEDRAGGGSDMSSSLEAKLNDAIDEIAAAQVATELQPASGAEGGTGGAAASTGDASATSGEPAASGSSNNSPGTETSSADASGQTREEADASTADRKVVADVGNQPEDTPQPPAAELNTENGPSAAAAVKPAGKAKPKSATETKV